jgi:Tail-tube assembly protein
MPTPFTPNGQNATQKAPLGSLNTSQYTYSSFIYPLDLATDGAGSDHYMVFHINQSGNTQFNTVTVNGQAQNGVVNTITGANGQTLTSTLNVNNGVGQGPNGNNAAATNMTQNSQNVTRVATTIVLYMPNDIQTNYHADWKDEDLGVAADLMSKVQGTKSWTDVVTSGAASALKNIGMGASEFTGLSLGSASSATSRFAINPHAEVIFNGVQFREFHFKFRMVPTSEDEAINIDNIVRAFKFYAAPEILEGSAGRFWIYPAEFDIQYFSNGEENELLNKISTCALTDIVVNYTGTGHWAAHRPVSSVSVSGNPPVCTEIALTFKELEIMTKEKILSGY